MQSPVLPRVAALAAGLLVLFSAGVRAVEVEADASASVPRGLKDPGTRLAEAEIAPASNEAEQALKRMQLPAGLQASLWAAEPMLANPVAFNIDEQGRIFVAETYRYGSSVLDIRNYLWMLEEDLACRTIEDRTKLIAAKFGPEGTKELSLESERLRLLEDRDGDGKADFSTVYAEGFNTPLDGVAAGVLIRRGEVWFTNIPSLWKLTGREKAEQRVELSRGYGVRFNYTGHDLHGPIWGPDGKIYFSIGDRGAHVPTKEGGVVDVPDMGAVFRCNPDGTELELFAYGLRNPQSLLFTENGDLFTGDNDSDQGDQERLVQLVENGDSGWRVGYQFAPLGNAGPWNTEKMWHPRHAGQAAYLLPPIANIEDGPSGIAYYPGTGLNDSYRGSIFITHFKGSIARSGIFDYKLKPAGASYAIADAKPFLTSSLPTDVRFGPDGRVYYSDWAEGWPKSKKGRIYAIFDPAHVNDPLVKETKAIIASDFTRKSDDTLVQLLAHADWRVRLEAQFTLAERGGKSIARFASVLQRPEPGYAGLHAIWGLGQLAGREASALAPVRAALKHGDAEVRAQAAKVLGDRRMNEAFDDLIAALRDDHARVRFFAAQSLGKLGRPEAAPALLAVLRENDDRDLYLRHAAVMGLVGGKNLEALAAAAKSDSRAERLGVLLAWRRLHRPELAQFLSDADPFLRREAALAINDEPVDGAFPALAALLSDASSGTAADEPVMLRAINANFRLGGVDHAQALARYAAQAGAPAALRAEALKQLALWRKPPARDRIVGVYRPIHDAGRAPEAAAVALSEVAGSILSGGAASEVEAAAIEAIVALQARAAADALVATVRDAQQPGDIRAAALAALAKLQAGDLTELVAFARESDSPELRIAALPVAAKLSPEAAAPLLEKLATQGNAEEQRAAYQALGTLQLPAADKLLIAQLKKLNAGEIPAPAQLELLEALQQRSDPAIKQMLADRDAALAASPDPLAPYRVALEGGNPRKGRDIFRSQPVMSCIRCHDAGFGGGDAGPNLVMVGARRTREYLLEAVVKPNAAIAPGFDSVVVTLKSGGLVGGIVSTETEDTLSLKDADGKVVDVKKSNIASREGAPSSMPEIYGAVLSKTELRDVVAFLASLTKESGGGAGPEKLRALRTEEEIAAMQ